MSTFRRRLMQLHSEPKPYDAEVEYLQSDSTAYIDTGINGNNDNLEISVIFSYSTHITYGAVLGNYIADNINSTRIILSGQNDTLYVNLNTVSTTGGNILIEGPIDRNNKVLLSSFKIYSNVNIYTPSIKKGVANNNNIALFNRSLTNPNTTRNIGLKIFAFSIKDNSSGELLRDMIPVRVGSVGYMYDKVSSRLFGSVGSGSFSFGEDKGNSLMFNGYTQIECVKNISSNIYSLPVGGNISDENFTIDSEFAFSELHLHNEVYTSFQSESQSKTRIYVPQSGKYLSVTNHTVKGLIIYPDGGVQIGHKYHCISTYDYCVLDNVRYDIPEDNKSQYGLEGKILLFGRVNVPFIGKIYRFKIYHYNYKMVDLIPCVNKDGVFGFYDLVTYNFIGNENLTGE